MDSEEINVEASRRKRHIEQPTDYPKDAPGGANYVEAATEMGSAAIKGMAPAERGWILAAVILMLGAMALIQVTNYLENAHRNETTGKFFVEVESNRSEENRRLQEQNRILAQALARQADRVGRKEAERQSIDAIRGVPE